MSTNLCPCGVAGCSGTQPSPPDIAEGVYVTRSVPTIAEYIETLVAAGFVITTVEVDGWLKKLAA